MAAHSGRTVAYSYRVTLRSRDLGRAADRSLEPVLAGAEALRLVFVVVAGAPVGAWNERYSVTSTPGAPVRVSRIVRSNSSNAMHLRRPSGLNLRSTCRRPTRARLESRERHFPVPAPGINPTVYTSFLTSGALSRAGQGGPGQLLLTDSGRLPR